MIISDLSHLEVVSEAISVVGGNSKTVYTTADKLISPDLLKKLSPKIRALLKKSKGKVVPISSKRKGGSASAKIGSFNTGKGKALVSSTYSSSII